ncbi:hypothetical protein [Streptomyces sp. NPDC057702]|uniref:hypothetical protein n=1 Tax=unclassified Streptomyces TaxID=2593676 RepID=UPI00368ADD6B
MGRALAPGWTLADAALAVRPGARPRGENDPDPAQRGEVHEGATVHREEIRAVAGGDPSRDAAQAQRSGGL